MNSIEVIRNLSDEGAKKMHQVLSWLNPLPESGEELVEKINYAIERADYARNAQGSTHETGEDLAALSKLRHEILSILEKG